MKRHHLLIAVLVAAVLLAPPLLAQGGGEAYTAGAGVPRSLRAYTHVFVAFSVAWVLLFGYTLTIGRRFRALEAEVEALRRR